MAAKLNWLDLPVDRAARVVGLDLLAGARSARERLKDPADAAALHDFRVAVRRLRSWLRAFRGTLEDEPSSAVRRGLRSLAAATGSSRDAEVQLEWLGARRARFPARQRAVLLALMRHFETQRQIGSRQIARAASRFDALAPRLERELLSYRPRVAVLAAPAPSVGARSAAGVAARLLRTQADELRDQLALVRTSADEAPAHAARIEGKRLRYLLEPLRATTRGARETVDHLKQLQDALGELHDAHVLWRVSAKLGTRAGGGTRRAAGATALRDLVARRVRLAFAALQQQWPASRVAALHVATGKVATALDARAHEGLEIERKFLLSGIPREVRQARHVTIDQGYLPGRVIGERIRRVRDGRRIDHVRSLKAGTGMVRMELEEKTTKAIFDGLWRLTKGRRLRKRRHVVPAGDLAWEVDVFLDRDLVLAEVEIPTEDTPVPIPHWLAPFIVREVTSERRFENHQLALARTRRPAKARQRPGGRRGRA